MAPIDDILQGMESSLDGTNESIQKLLEIVGDDKHPELIKSLLADNKNKLEHVSLLDLKNNSMVAYLNQVILIILAHLERVKAKPESNVEDLKTQAVDQSIVQRVTLERGIKPLEKKLNYQLEKMIRSYNKMEQDFSKQDKEDGTKNASDDESEESEDELSYKPDASLLMKKPMRETTSNETYKPPKITAMAPPTAQTDTTKSNTRKLQSMEEYLRENSDLPMEDKSIGVNIVNHGRGGVKTNKDREKEVQLQRYEEDNFTRLPATSTKKDKDQKRKELESTFAGEDWSMFSNSRNISESTSRKRKTGSVWDKVKRGKR